MKRKIPESFHPSEYLKDELKERGWSVDKLAKKLDVPPITVKRVISEQLPISPALADRLSRVLGTGSEIWLNLQAAYDLAKKIQSAQKNRESKELTLEESAKRKLDQLDFSNPNF